jgi:uncharacterized membrane protein
MTPRVLTPVLALAGLIDAAYLTVVHYREDLLVCTVGGCETVQQSKYSEIAGIPIAMLGILMFIAVLGLALARWRRPDLAENATMAIFTMVLTGTLYFAYLTYVEIAVLDAICQWCVVASLITLAILVIEGIAVYRLLGAPE